MWCAFLREGSPLRRPRPTRGGFATGLLHIARPYTWWRICLVAAMGVAFLLVLAVPWLQDFFVLKLVGVTMPWVAVGIAVVAAATLELVWRWVDRRFPA